jgi:hypothetical protein
MTAGQPTSARIVQTGHMIFRRIQLGAWRVRRTVVFARGMHTEVERTQPVRKERPLIHVVRRRSN